MKTAWSGITADQDAILHISQNGVVTTRTFRALQILTLPSPPYSLLVRCRQPRSAVSLLSPQGNLRLPFASHEILQYTEQTEVDLYAPERQRALLPVPVPHGYCLEHENVPSPDVWFLHSGPTDPANTLFTPQEVEPHRVQVSTLTDRHSWIESPPPGTSLVLVFGAGLVRLGRTHRSIVCLPSLRGRRMCVSPGERRQPIRIREMPDVKLPSFQILPMALNTRLLSTEWLDAYHERSTDGSFVVTASLQLPPIVSRYTGHPFCLYGQKQSSIKPSYVLFEYESLESEHLVHYQTEARARHSLQGYLNRTQTDTQFVISGPPPVADFIRSLRGGILVDFSFSTNYLTPTQCVGLVWLDESGHTRREVFFVGRTCHPSGLHAIVRHCVSLARASSQHTHQNITYVLDTRLDVRTTYVATLLFELLPPTRTQTIVIGDGGVAANLAPLCKSLLFTASDASLEYGRGHFGQLVRVDRQISLSLEQVSIHRRRARAPRSALPIGYRRLITQEFETLAATDEELVPGGRYALSLHNSVFRPILAVLISRGGSCFQLQYLLSENTFLSSETEPLRPDTTVYLLYLSALPEYWTDLEEDNPPLLEIAPSNLPMVDRSTHPRQNP